MKTYEEEQMEGICNLCKKEWGTGEWCNTEHNHSYGEDMLICCDCWCEKNPDFHCPDAWRYREWEEAECNGCGEMFPVSELTEYPDGSPSGGTAPYCRECETADEEEEEEENPTTP